jgi:dephospho-CoA kinase
MILGLTGSMASGKSTVSKMLAARGFTVLDADRIAHEALEDPNVKRALTERFGGDILTCGVIDRARLAEKAFASDGETAALNAIVHPFVIKKTVRKAYQALFCDPDAAVVLDVPLLFESGMDGLCDAVLVVAADNETRYLRIMLRDGLSREQAKRRIEKQMPQEEKMERADAVIMNDGTLEELEERLEKALSALGLDRPVPDKEEA